MPPDNAPAKVENGGYKPPAVQLDYNTIVMNLISNPQFDVAKLERILELRYQEELRVAEKEYSDAMADACAEMEPIRANMLNPMTRSKYAKLSVLLDEIRPILGKYRVYLSWDYEPSTKDNEIIVVAVVRKGAFVVRHRLPVPVDAQGLRGGQMMTRTHAQLSSVTYGRRGLTKMVCNLAEEADDDDGNKAGNPRFQSGTSQAAQRVADAPRRAAAEATVPKEPPRDETGKRLAPHQLQNNEDEMTWQEWGVSLLAAVNAAENEEEIDKWLAENNSTLQEMHEQASVMYERLNAAINKARNRVKSTTTTSQQQGEKG